MTKTELKTLYVHACVRAGTKPNATEEGAWQKAYAYTERADFEAAIDAHFRSQKFLPRESELSRSSIPRAAAVRLRVR